jgi:hypothetical protein
MHAALDDQVLDTEQFDDWLSSRKTPACWLVRDQWTIFELHGSALSPRLAEGTDFEVEGPGALRLLVELPIGFSHGSRRHQEGGVIQRVRPESFDPPLTHPFGINAGADDEMGDMDVLGPELARSRLRNGAQSELRASESRIADAPAQVGGRADEEDVALAARQHQLRRFTPGKEAGVAGHFPDLAEHAFGRIQNRKIDVDTDIEDADFQRRVLVRIAEERDDFFLLARIERARMDFTALPSIAFTSGSSLAPFRLPAKTVNPSEANFLAISPPM